MVELDWRCKVMAEAPNPCIRRPTSLSYLITRHFSILLRSGWAYGSNLTLFHFCAGGGGILRNLGYGRALVMWNSHGWGSKPMQIASHIHIVDIMSYISKWFSTLLCCGWAGPSISIHWSIFVLVHMGGGYYRTSGMVMVELCCKNPNPNLGYGWAWAML